MFYHYNDSLKILHNLHYHGRRLSFAFIKKGNWANLQLQYVRLQLVAATTGVANNCVRVQLAVTSSGRDFNCVRLQLGYQQLDEPKRMDRIEGS
jgi:hypothetical protein